MAPVLDDFSVHIGQGIGRAILEHDHRADGVPIADLKLLSQATPHSSREGVQIVSACRCFGVLGLDRGSPNLAAFGQVFH